MSTQVLDFCHCRGTSRPGVLDLHAKYIYRAFVWTAGIPELSIPAESFLK